jgi:hypothetical protein
VGVVSEFLHTDTAEPWCPTPLEPTSYDVPVVPGRDNQDSDEDE